MTLKIHSMSDVSTENESLQDFLSVTKLTLATATVFEMLKPVKRRSTPAGMTVKCHSSHQQWSWLLKRRDFLLVVCK